MKILAIDIETTGVEPMQDTIVEIGAIEVTEDGELGEQVQTLVDPCRPIPPEASAVHHLVYDDVRTAPLIDEAIKQFKGYDLYIAHKASFEESFLPLPGPWLCTYKAAVRVWRNAPGYSLQVLRYWRELNIPQLEKDAPMHRALPDAIVAAALFCDLKKFASVEEMLQWTQEPAVLPYFTFGKHAMAPVDQLPSGYLEWILTRDDFDPDVSHTARHELNRRAE